MQSQKNVSTDWMWSGREVVKDDAKVFCQSLGRMELERLTRMRRQWRSRFSRACEFSFGHCISLLGCYNTIRCLEQHALTVSHSGSWKSKIKVPAGLFPAEGCEGRICSRSLLLACRQLSFLYVTSQYLPSLCVAGSNFPFFIRTSVTLD